VNESRRKKHASNGEGDAPANICGFAHMGSSGASTVAASISLRANAWGGRDMLDNVSEPVFY